MLSTSLRPAEQSVEAGPRPLPTVLRPACRLLLRTWSRFPKATGYLTQVIERWGARLAERPLECCLSNGLRMTCDLRDHVQRQIYFRGAYEPIEAYLFRHLLRPGMVVVDAGANVGQYALNAALEVGRDGEVHAFEPVPSNFKMLKEHVLVNGLQKVRVNMTALWHQEGVLSLHLASDMVGNNGSYTVGIPPDVVQTIDSEAIRLDYYVSTQGVGRVDLIKMDIEGAELYALQGATEVLSRWRPTMLMEINRVTCRRLGYEPEQILRFLKPLNYRAWVVGESPETCHRLTSLEGVDRANVIFHTNELPDEVSRGWTLKSVLRFHRGRAKTLRTNAP
jgi:FkbM family methyltransferase